MSVEKYYLSGSELYTAHNYEHPINIKVGDIVHWRCADTFIEFTQVFTSVDRDLSIYACRVATEEEIALIKTHILING